MTMPSTLFDKIWEAHEVAPAFSTSTCTSSTRSRARRPSTGCASPGAVCAGLIARSPRPTTTPHRRHPIAARIKDELSRVQVETLERNCAEFAIPIYSSAPIARASST